MANLLLENHKLIHHPDVMLKFKKGESFAPVIVELSPAARCNQACEMCYVDYVMNDDRSPRLMERDMYFKAIKDCGDFGVKALSFCGTGEPLMHPDTPDAIAYTKQLGMDACLISNGVLATPKRMEKCLGALSYLRVSTTAGSAERYARTQGSTERAFHTMMQNMEDMVKLKHRRNFEATVGMAYFVLEGAEDDIVPYVRRLRDIGVDYVQVKPLGDFEKNNYVYDKSYYHKLDDAFAEVEALGTDAFTVLVRHNRFKEFENFREDDPNGGAMPGKCWALYFTTVIGSDAKVYTCGGSWYEEKDCYGSLKDHTLEELWGSERYQEIFKRRSKVNTRDCFFACRNHVLNGYLMDFKEPPAHVNFI